MSTTATRLVWIQTAQDEVEAHIAECGPYVFEICTSAATNGYLLRVRRVRPEDSASKISLAGGDTEVAVAKKLLTGGQRDAFLQGHRGKRMP